MTREKICLIFAAIIAIQGIALACAAENTSISSSISIYSPLNETYSFLPSDDFTIDLNVSSSIEISSWWYDLEGISHSITVDSGVLFIPNATLNAVRGENRLKVYTSDQYGNIESENVTFFVYVPDSAPLLGDIQTALFACEGSRLSYKFNASDPDYDNLQVSVSPANPFFVLPSEFTNNVLIEPELLSRILTEKDVGIHALAISVSDGQYTDTRYTNVTVLEKGNSPYCQGQTAEENCTVKWVCGQWQTCQNAELALKNKRINTDDFARITGECNSTGIQLSDCGFQARECLDVNSCGILDSVPYTEQACSYSANPGCSDGIRNCHDGSCELNIDCGGPCSACASCSDGLKNQEEAGIDCGGPCTIHCSVIKSYNLFSNKNFVKALWFLLLLAAIIIFWKLYNLLREKIELAKERKLRRVFSG